MDELGRFLSFVDHTLNTKKRRHIAGGILVSISLLFGGLAVTVLTLNIERNEDTDVENNDRCEFMYTD